MTATCNNDGLNICCTQPPGSPHYDAQTLILPDWTIDSGGDDRVYTHIRVRTQTVNPGVAYKF